MQSERIAARQRAAQYIRMSTDRQVYSLEGQAAAIAIYAVGRDIDVVRTYKDEGRSGLSLHGREGLQQLLGDVQGGRADFTLILVYDVSRWGRFQDTDESAHYEFVCKQAGIKVIYCAEQFENDDSPTSVIVKAIKRLMAGEYSRELSTKVRDGIRRGAAKGFWQGGTPGLGLRRFMIDQHRHPKCELRKGELKSLHTDRVILIPGPPDEVRTIQQIFREFVRERSTPKEIAEALNKRGVVTSTGRHWSAKEVRLILRNPNYAGHNRWHQTSKILGKFNRRVRHPPDQWLVIRDAFEALVSPEIYDKAQMRLEARAHNISNERLIERFRLLLADRGTISLKMVREAEDMPSLTTVARRLGGLQNLYRALDFTPERSPDRVEVRVRLRCLKFELVRHVCAGLEASGSTARVLSFKSGLMLVNNHTIVATAVKHRELSPAGTPCWRIATHAHRPMDLVLVQLLDESMRTVVAHYLFEAGQQMFRAYISEPLMSRHDPHRLGSLDDVFARLSSKRDG